MLVPPILIVPNLRTVVDLGLYGSLLGVMAPYFASAFGTFLMRQTFRQIPRDFEEAAVIDGAQWWQILWHVLLPMAKPGLIAFSLVSLMAHWNEFLWPLMVLNEPSDADAHHRSRLLRARHRRRPRMGPAGRRHAARHVPAARAVRDLPASVRQQLHVRRSQGIKGRLFMRWLSSLGRGRRRARRSMRGAGADQDRLLLPGAGRRQAGEGDDAADQGLQRQPEGHRRHRRLYRQLRRDQAQGPGRRQRRQAAGGGADERQLRARPQDRRRHRSRSSRMLKADGTTRTKFLDDFWPARARQRHRRRRALRHPLSRTRRRCSITTRSTSRKRASIRRSRRRPGPSWSMPPRS